MNEESSDLQGSYNDVVASRIKSMRLRAGLSLRSAADKVGGGVHFTTLGKLENGKMGIDADWAAKLAIAYGGSVSEILSGPIGASNKTVPLYDITGATSLADIECRKPIKRVVSPIGGPRSFAIFYVPPQELYPKLLDGYYVVDPDWRKLSGTNTYLLVVHGNRMFVGIYDISGNIFRSTPGAPDNEVKVGDDPFVVIGRILFSGVQL